jgi:hypothetical protein
MRSFPGTGDAPETCAHLSVDRVFQDLSIKIFTNGDYIAPFLSKDMDIA